MINTSFYTNFALLIENPARFSKDIIEKDVKTKNLSFTFLLVFLLAACQYIGFSIAFGIGNNISLFAYLMFMMLYGSLFFLFLFLDSAIINHFLKDNNTNSNHKFFAKDTFTLLSISSYPYLFLPAAAIFAKFLNAEGLYCLFILFTATWVIRTKFKMLTNYSYLFAISPCKLVILPFFVQGLITFLLILTFSISFFYVIINALNNLSLNKLFYI